MIIASDNVSEQEDRSAADVVLTGILYALEARQLVPGQRLVEVDLAASFEVSRNSVREALQRLAAEGVVELSRHKGAAIRLLSLQETLDVLDVAERISGLLAKAAARAVGQGADGESLAAAVGALVAGADAGDSAAFAKARRAYYRALLSLANNRELRRLFASIQMPIVYAQYTLPDLQQIRLQDYQVIAREVLAGDEDGADLAAMAHVQSVRAAILRQASAETPRVWASSPKPIAAPHTRDRDSQRPRRQD